jgi:preprotein translocase subunit SecA
MEVRRMAAANLLDFARPADRAFLTKAADGEFFDAEAVDAVYADGPEAPPPADQWREYYDLTSRPEEDEGPDFDLEALAAQRDMLAPLDNMVPAEGPARAEAKVGRNDPCPCGSGKKYKKCCG